MIKQILITGANRLVGRELIKALMLLRPESNFEITALVRSQSAQEKLVNFIGKDCLQKINFSLLLDQKTPETILYKI